MRDLKNIICMLTIATLHVGLVVQASESVQQKTWTEKILGSIGQSGSMHVFSTSVQKTIDVKMRAVLQYGDELASQKYQEMGLQAQKAVGIPQEYQVPVRKINLASPLAALVGAVAESDAIYVNEEKLDKRTHGQNYSALCHEAVHIKYHDKATDTVLESAGLIGVSMGACKALQALGIVACRKRLSFAFACCAILYGIPKFNHFRERRADIEGHNATQCFQCVKEHAQLREQLFEKDNSPLKNHGYLWAKELEQIAHNLGDKKCTYHRK